MLPQAQRAASRTPNLITPELQNNACIRVDCLHGRQTSELSQKSDTRIPTAARYMAPEIIRGEGYSGTIGLIRFCPTCVTCFHAAKDSCLGLVLQASCDRHDRSLNAHPA